MAVPAGMLRELIDALEADLAAARASAHRATGLASADRDIRIDLTRLRPEAGPRLKLQAN